ncbi:MAG: class I SAM-dependent methyltransferase [Desulfamplus sp.]|nr:class I SAM-dependent methyltransferase [Desulfamplus sp.]
MSINCPICESFRIHDFWDKVWMDDHSSVKQCKDCSLFFLFPQRTEEEQKVFDQQYNQYISQREVAVSVKDQKSFADMVDESIRERYEDVKEFFSVGQSVLEIGAEKGGFLDMINSSVHDVTGVDSCPEYKDLLKDKGYEAYLYIDEIPPDRQFDVICFFSLLEHIQNPHDFLEQLKRHLKKDGFFLIEVPSAQDPLISLYDIDAFKSFYFQAMHPYVYHVDTLQILFQKRRLKISEIKYKQRYGLANHLQWLRHGVPGGNTLFQDVFSDSETSYTNSLEKKGYTDTVYVIAENE